MSYDTNNIFAKIIRGEIPAKKIFEDDFVLAIEDVSPASAVHVLVIPKGNFVSFDDFATHAPAEIIAHFFGIIPTIAKQLGIETSGYRLITNHGKHAHQTVPHFHVHLLGGNDLGGLLQTDPHHR